MTVVDGSLEAGNHQISPESGAMVLGVAPSAYICNHFESWKEARCFCAPVLDHGNGTDYQRRKPSGGTIILLRVLNCSQSLKGLAESHVVGQDAIQPESLHEDQPV